MHVAVYYDGDCPFCSRYVQYLRLKDAVTRLHLVDVRTDGESRRRLTNAGLDLDNGMVAEIGGRTYHGADAMHALSLLAGPSGWVNRLLASVFASRPLAVIAYPVLRAGRSVVLDLLGRGPVAGEDAGLEAKFRLFALLFGFFSVFHAIAYVLHYGRFPPSPDIIVLLALAVGVVLRPQARGLFLGLMLVSLISGWLQAPASSNHTMLRNYVALAFAVIYVAQLLRGTGWQRVFADFSVVAGAGLMVMYVFGIFHKINTGFLDPAVSCAVTLWRMMPPPLSYLDGPVIQYGAIYGTFLVEGLILVGLFIRPLRHVAVAAGILFHWLLALSNFSNYLPFTTLSMSLHVLFLSSGAAARVWASPVMAAFTLRLRQPLWIAVGATYVAVMAFMVALDRYSTATLLASLFILPVAFAILRYGGVHEASPRSQVAGMRGRALAAVLGGLFFLSCLLPYAGLKTAQAMNMFANLRVEGGVSNHLVFRDPPSLFDNLADVVIVTKIENAPGLRWMLKEGTGIVYNDLLARLRANPAATVSFVRDGVLREDQNAASLAADIKTKLYAPVWDKFVAFRPVTLDMPPKCE
ncbi:MAG: DUF393 domain-containing protein [Rhizobiaceae bacterium]